MQALFICIALIRYKKIRAYKKKYENKYGKIITNDPAIIDQLSELYLKESKTLISLLYQFFYGFSWTKTGSSADYFEQHMRAVRWSLFVRIYWFCIFMGAVITASLIVYIQTKNVVNTIFISTIPSIVFVTIFLIDIWCYKKNLAQLKITVEKYNDTSLSAIGELLSLYSKCKKSIVWSIADVFARNHVS